MASSFSSFSKFKVHTSHVHLRIFREVTLRPSDRRIFLPDRSFADLIRGNQCLSMYFNQRIGMVGNSLLHCIVLLLLAIRAHASDQLMRRLDENQEGGNKSYSMDINICAYSGTVPQIREVYGAVVDVLPPFIDRSRLRINIVVHANNSHLWPPSWTIVHQPNLGREAGCILGWITSRYHGGLADFTCFLHDRLDSYSRHRVARRIQTVFTPQTGMLALAIIDNVPCDGHSWTESVSPDDIGEQHDYPNKSRVTHQLSYIREIYAMTQGRFCFEHFSTSFNGKFIVSKKRILGQPLSLYQYLLDLMTTRRLFKHYNPATKKTREDPKGGIFFAYLMERSWGLICALT
jgi:hypothetical protein